MLSSLWSIVTNHPAACTFYILSAEYISKNYVISKTDCVLLAVCTAAMTTHLSFRRFFAAIGGSYCIVADAHPKLGEGVDRAPKERGDVTKRGRDILAREGSAIAGDPVYGRGACNRERRWDTKCDLVASGSTGRSISFLHREWAMTIGLDVILTNNQSLGGKCVLSRGTAVWLTAL